MSQSIRTPRGIAIRAVAAASLFASKPKPGGKDAAEETSKNAGELKLKSSGGGAKPQVKR